jgi:hypothetical protein
MRASYPIGFDRRVVSVVQMRRWRHPAALLAIGAAVLLLPACGGSGDQTQSSTAAADNSKGASGPASEAVEMATGSAPKRSATAGQRKSSGRPDDSDLEADQRSSQNSGPRKDDKNAGQQKQAHEAPKPVHIRGCPVGMSKSQCEQVGIATQQKGSNSHVVAKGECPAAMSQDECRQAGEVYEEASEGHVVQPNECPRAMTAEQCAEAGKAYEEATK